MKSIFFKLSQNITETRAVWCWSQYHVNKHNGWNLVSWCCHQCLITITLVKRIGIAFFLRSHFFGFTHSFRIFGHAFVYNRWKGNIFKIFGFSVTIFVLLFVKLMQHTWFGVYQINTLHIYWADLVQKFKILSLS